MALGDALQKRMEELAKRQPVVRKRFMEIAEGATLRAVEAAAERTPPNTFNDGELRGVNMITGELSEHWGTDSQTVPVQAGSDYTTTLQNDKDYAGYVNDGHRMDRHFVPGLYVNPHSGLLEYDPARNVGITVGTKTKYVPGEFMTDKAEDAYRKTASSLLNGALGRALK